MLAYSWQAYLIAHYRFSDWIDRGRLHPTHQEWSEYLRWVAGQLPSTSPRVKPSASGGHLMATAGRSPVALVSAKRTTSWRAMGSS